MYNVLYITDSIKKKEEMRSVLFEKCGNKKLIRKKKEKVEEFRGVWSRAVVPLAHKLSLGLF